MLDDFNKMTDYELYLFVKSSIFRSHFSTITNSPNHSSILESIADLRPDIFDRATQDALVNISTRIQFAESPMQVVNIEPISLMSKEELINHLNNEIKGDGEVSVVNETNQIESLSDLFGVKSGEIFFAKVRGDSMLDAKIESGDTLLVEISDNIISGSIVIASVNGYVFVKRLKFDSENTYLISENKLYPPFKVTKSIDFKVIGLVRGILRRVL